MQSNHYLRHVVILNVAILAVSAIAADPLTTQPIDVAASEVRIISEGSEVCDDIYGEMPFMDASSRYVLYIRLPGALKAEPADREPYRRTELWRADLQTRTTRMIAEGAFGIKGMAISPDQKYFYYATGDTKPWLKAEVESITRIDIVSLETKTVSVQGSPRRITTMGTIGKDPDRYFAAAFLGPQRYGIIRIDLNDGIVKVIHASNAEIFNAHPQIDPDTGQRLLVQHNRGAQVDDEGKMIKAYGKTGTTLYTIDLAGHNQQAIRVGVPHSPTIQGHEAWVPGTGSILFTTHWGTLQQRAERGNIWTIHPGDETPRPIARGFTFWHCNPSRCGQYFIADTRGGPVIPNPDGSKREESPYILEPTETPCLIVLGSIATGKTKILCQTKAKGTQAQYTHPHVYLSPDNGWAIFNSERDGVPHVAAARIPSSVFADLDSR